MRDIDVTYITCLPFVAVRIFWKRRIASRALSRFINASRARARGAMKKNSERVNKHHM